MEHIISPGVDEEVVVKKCCRCDEDLRVAADAYKLFGGPRFCFDCSAILQKQDEEKKLSNKVANCLLSFRMPNNLKAKDGEPSFLGLIEHDLTQSQEKAVDIFKQGNSVYIWGGIGSGKTYVSCMCACNKISKGVETVFFTASGFQSSFFTRDQNPLVDIKSKACLLVDDLGNHNITQNVVSDILELLSYRINEGLTTIFTSNYNPAELAERLKIGAGKTTDSAMCDAIADRILELCRVVKVDGDSFRVKRFMEEHRNG